MVQFHIQTDSDIPASTQLFNQIRFAIASRQFPPGHRLPSTRQLAMQTGLHRNTISKVYRQLEQTGLVAAQAGSGIYVRALGHEGGSKLNSPILEQYPLANKIVQESLDELLGQGCTLNQARELFLAEIDWRLRCSARVIVTAPTEDIGVGELMARELEQALRLPIQLVSMEELAAFLDQIASGTVITSRYFIGEAESIAAPRSVRVIPVDINDYRDEIELVSSLPKDSYLGLVSISPGMLRSTEVIVHSLRGEDLLVMTAMLSDTYKINSIVRSARTIFCDQPSFATVKAAVSAAREDIIRPPQLICSENYIGSKSIDLLKRELGLG
ncbi:MAG: GntR family transcriptional regulator [Oscillatoriaceae cyanobacterium Prado104]|jgi:GntR family transcriptional regulator|nr:GntR family transcriptional regulator [Oscillatoriaceae cyanobacterium Prado104]